ncbi:MAG: Ig-like domain-containing protein [Bacteroidota bacterium]|nr:Ig-like domain-containing protein [Bacteroidota bacterium]
MKSSLLLIALTLLFTFVSAQTNNPLQEDRSTYNRYFETAAAEFHVPADVLRGIAFAETRWSQLKWAPGDTASCMGMPHPYGIMSLWDNDFFGHSLREAAALIGKDPQVLKDDAYQNIRGAAALLRKLYDKNPLPDSTTTNDIESWRNAIAAYSYVPQRDYAQKHALDIYTEISQGYHKYGIGWNARPVKLAPIRTAVGKIEQEEEAKRAAQLRKTGEVQDQPDYPGAKWAQAYPGHWYTTGYPKDFVVIHDMEGYYEAVISYFQQSTTSASIFYCINGLQNGSDSHGHAENNPGDAPRGEITQMVEEKYWAWHVLCWNRYMFGIEHEGFVNDPAWYTDEMYRASAALTSYLCDKYGIPKDRNHIIGHQEWQNGNWVNWINSTYNPYLQSKGIPTFDPTCNNHTDPGQYWNWTYYMSLVTGEDSIPPQIVSTFPPGNSNDSPAYKDVVLQFDYPMDHNSTDSAFSIAPNVAGTFSWSSDSKALTFHPTSLLAFSTTYTVKIDSTAMNSVKKEKLDGNGDGKGGDAFQFSFTTERPVTTPPVILSMYPRQSENNVSTFADAFVTMSKPLQYSSLSGRILLKDISGNSVSVSNPKLDSVNDRGIITFTPDSLNPGTSYIVTFAAGIKDVYGNATTSDASVHFTTSPETVTQGILYETFESNTRLWQQPIATAGTVGADSSATNFVRTTEKKKSGSYSGRVTYRFAQGSGGVIDEQASGRPPIDSSKYTVFGVWVYGDLSGNEVDAVFQPSNQTVALDTLNWYGWKYLSCSLGQLAGSSKQLSDFLIKQVQSASTSGVVYFDDIQLNSIVNGVAGNLPGVPDKYSLEQNYPNPFNPTTHLRFTIAGLQFVTLKVYDVLGREVATLVNEQKSPGTYEVNFDARLLPSGVYFYRLEAGSFAETKKLVVVR